MTTGTVNRSAKPSAPRPPKVELDPIEKQIMRSVQYGRKCTFHIFDCDPITGYVAAMGMYRYLVLHVVDGEVKQSLIHKGSSPQIDLHQESTFEAEAPEIKDVMLEVIRPFRRWVTSQFSRSELSA